MRTYALFGAKNVGFFAIYGVSARTIRGGGVEPVRTFSDKGGGVNFSRFCVDVFYERPLITFTWKNFIFIFTVSSP